MIAEGFRFEGFDASSWLNLLSLFSARGRARALIEPSAPAPRGTLVVVRDEQGLPCASFVTGRGAVELPASDPSEDLEGLCQRLGVARAVLIQDGTIEELTEGASEGVLACHDYAQQWLVLLELARTLEDEGKLQFFPPRSRLPLPSAAMLQRTLDVLLPDDHVFLLGLWDGPELWTGCALQRRGGEIECMIGPERLLEWTGPLGGDYRRDHRAMQRAVQRALGPVHIGLFAQRTRVEELLIDPNPGAWARAFALRDVIIDPAPPYVHVAVGADAARAAGAKAAEWLGGLDLLSYVAPAGEFVRDRIARVGSVSSILGFNPLQALANRLRRDPERDPP